jgi:hypothetical protein
MTPTPQASQYKLDKYRLQGTFATGPSCTVCAGIDKSRKSVCSQENHCIESVVQGGCRSGSPEYEEVHRKWCSSECFITIIPS